MKTVLPILRLSLLGAMLALGPMAAVQAQIAVFGAGHVGRALVPLLAALPCRVR